MASVHIIHAICQTVTIGIDKASYRTIRISSPSSFYTIKNTIIITVQVQIIRDTVAVRITHITADYKQADKINEITNRSIMACGIYRFEPKFYHGLPCRDNVITKINLPCSISGRNLPAQRRVSYLANFYSHCIDPCPTPVSNFPLEEITGFDGQCLVKTCRHIGIYFCKVVSFVSWYRTVPTIEPAIPNFD